ncbi:hypothetical protein [Winogradskyella endarachnes]|uniref:Uncharacterized protein n=1 Tax=Winogradskyella endarachnes TaxID=2681965 RepID=A0A6L6U4X2_9FLAO|nr:hypothetical protein [Winogradskyella endarachnes]MUU76909.1 hypothetical protein [Winogradskyella endarachnes]
MTLNIYLLLLSLVFFTIVTDLFYNLNTVNDFNYIVNDQNSYTSNLRIKFQDLFSTRQKSSISSNEEKIINALSHEQLKAKDLLNKYNKQLNRSLKTLKYIAEMEIQLKTDKDNFKDLFNLKKNIQLDVVRLTAKINFYRSKLQIV